MQWVCAPKVQPFVPATDSELSHTMQLQMPVMQEDQLVQLNNILFLEREEAFFWSLQWSTCSQRHLSIHRFLLYNECIINWDFFQSLSILGNLPCQWVCTIPVIQEYNEYTVPVLVQKAWINLKTDRFGVVLSLITVYFFIVMLCEWSYHFNNLSLNQKITALLKQETHWHLLYLSNHDPLSSFFKKTKTWLAHSNA